MKRPTLHVTNNLGPTGGALVAQLCAEVVARDGRCVLAVAGGSSPAPVFRWLAEHLDEAVHSALVVTFVDERHLPAASDAWSDLPADTNAALAYEHWFSQRMPQVLRWTLPGSLQAAAQQLEAQLQELGGVDVLLLGAGPDGHVASLFPGHPLNHTTAVVAVPDSPKPPPERLSLSMAWLQAAHGSVLIAKGEAKSSILKRAYEGDLSLPLAHALASGPNHWVLNPAAASLIEQESP